MATKLSELPSWFQNNPQMQPPDLAGLGWPSRPPGELDRQIQSELGWQRGGIPNAMQYRQPEMPALHEQMSNDIYAATLRATIDRLLKNSNR